VHCPNKELHINKINKSEAIIYLDIVEKGTVVNIVADILLALGILV
jgi:hypothetical protein